MNVTTTSTPGRTRRPRKARARRLATFAATAAAAVSALGLAAGPAMADTTTLTNGPTIQIGQFTPIAGYNSSSILPQDNGDTGVPTQIFVRSNSNQTDQALTIDLNSGAAGPVSTSDETSKPGAQYWYFQPIGYVGLSTPESAQFIAAGAPSTLLQEVPVYHIVSNVSALSDGPNCLSAMATAAGSTVASESCYSDSPSQMWVVGATSEEDPFIDSSTGQVYAPGPVVPPAPGILGTLGGLKPNLPADLPQWFSTTLQPGGTPSPGAVIENVGSLAADGWNTSTAPVLAATDNLAGANSAVTLEAQGFPAVPSDATWLLSAAIQEGSTTTFTATYGSTSTAPAQCNGFECLVQP